MALFEDDYISRRGKRYSPLQVGLAQGPFGIGSGRLKRSLALDEREARKKAMSRAQSFADRQTKRQESLEDESAKLAIRDQYKQDEEDRKRRLAQSGISPKIFNL